MSRSYYHTVTRRIVNRNFVAIRMSDYTEICRAEGRTEQESLSNLQRYAKNPAFRFAFPTNAKKRVDSLA